LGELRKADYALLFNVLRCYWRGNLLIQGLYKPVSLLQNPESEFDFFAARGEMEGAGAPFLA
jgi:hypothetical protein